MKTLRIVSLIFFLIFAVLTVVGIFFIINDSVSLYSIADNLPNGFIRDSAFRLFGLI